MIDLVISSNNTSAPNRQKKDAATVHNSTNRFAVARKVSNYKKFLTLAPHVRLLPAAMEIGGRFDCDFLGWLHEFYESCFDDAKVRQKELGRCKQLLSVSLRRAVADQYLTLERLNGHNMASFNIIAPLGP